MKNKKLVLSVLSTAVVASMATSAFAMPSAGLYIGGNVDKYYSVNAFLADANFDNALDEILNVGLNKVLFVGTDGKAANLEEIFMADKIEDVLSPVTAADFETDGYAPVNPDGTTGTVIRPDQDPDLSAPADLKVESVSAINSTSIKLDLNQEVALTTANVTVDGAAPTAVAQDAEDKTVWTLTVPALAAGDHTVVVKGLEGQTGELTSSLTFEAPVATTLSVDTNRIQDAANQALAVVVKDQYDQEMTIAATDVTVTAYNVTDKANLGQVADFADIDVDLMANVDKGDVIRFTVYLNSNPSLSVVKDVTVATFELGTISLNDPVVPTGAARITTGQTNVELPYTATDDAGDAFKLAAGNGKAAVEAANNIVINLTNIADVDVDAQGKLLLDLTGSTAGNASIRITNPATGVTVTKTFTVYAAEDTSEISLTAPTTPIRLGGGAKAITFQVKDQFGNVMDPATHAGWNTADVVLSSSNTNVATVAWNGNNLEVTPVAAGEAIITATVVTNVAGANKVATLPITISAAAAPTTVELAADVTTSLAQGQSVNDLAFVVKDQDGNAINLSGNYKIELQVTDTTDVLVDAAPTHGTDLAAADMSGTTGLTNTVAVTAQATSGTATIKAVLYNDAANAGTVDAGEKIFELPVTFTVNDQVVTNGTLTGANNLVFTSTGTEGFDYVAAVGATAGVDFTYALVDQAGNPVNATVNTDIEFSVTNNGSAALTVDNNGTPVTVAAGATQTFTQTIAAGNASANITIDDNAASNAVVTAKVKGNDATLKSTDIIFIPAANVLASNSNRTISGEVVAINKGVDATDGTDLVVKTAFGYFVVPAGVAYETVTIDGNTGGLGEAEIETVITYGDTVSIVLDNAGEGADADTITITNK